MIVLSAFSEVHMYYLLYLQTVFICVITPSKNKVKLVVHSKARLAINDYASVYNHFHTIP